MAKPNPLDASQEIQEMLVTYAKQETVEPLKTLGRYLGFGLGGAVLLFVGTLFVALGVLRLTQTLEVFEGTSWASTLPYLIAIASLAVIVGMILIALGRAKKKVA